MEIDVQRIAKLSKLQFTPEEMAAFQTEFTQIIKMVERLPELESTQTLIEPDNLMQLREDEVVQEYTRDQMLQNVPQKVAGCIVVPKTVE